MKRILSILMILCLIPLYAVAADEPKPIPVVAEENITPTPKGIRHYMLICVDQWDAKANSLGHTDGLVLVTVDEFAKRVMLTSFIRDMLIQRPDGKFGRINNVVGYFGNDQSGVDALIQTINTHFDIKIEKYIVVDFGQVQAIIDAVGGVDITVTAQEAEYLRNYAISSTSTTPSMAGAGTYHFSGHAAVIFMRIRRVLNSSGESQDLGRTRRVRTVLMTIADSLKDITYDQAMQLMLIVGENTCVTNMSSADMLDALDLGMRIKGTPIEDIRMPIKGSFHSMPVAGMATQEIDWPLNVSTLHDFLFTPYVVREDE